MNEPYQDFLRDVLITLHMNMKELRDRRGFADPNEISYIEAKLLVYEEMLGILRDSAKEFRIDGEQVGL